MTQVRDAILATARSLREAGIVSADAEARLLVSSAFDMTPAQLFTAGPLTSAQERRLALMTQRRRAGHLVQHITGRAWFRTVEVRVGPGVFVPRPETEVLAGWAIDQVKTGYGRVVELCAGSGAISRSIVAEANPNEVWAVERSEAAHRYLALNLADTSVVTMCMDMENALLEQNGCIDLVVANPPYVPLDAQGHLPREVAEDPPEALYSGADGLSATIIVARTAWRLLKPGGLVGSEHGEDQASAVREIFAARGFTDIATGRDLTGRPRFVTARKPSDCDTEAS